jgi:hypothetical protein
MTLYDPNWFYSSLAQSAAAVVGLIGAVLAARLQEQQKASRLSRDMVLGHLNGIREMTRSLKSGLERFRQSSEKHLGTLEGAVRRGEQTVEITEEVYFWGGSRGGSGWRIPTSHEEVQRYRDLQTLADTTSETLARYVDPATVSEARAIEVGIRQVKATLPVEMHPELGALRAAALFARPMDGMPLIVL